MAAVRPVSADEVCRIVQFANREQLALVPFGGGSGLMGGALSIRRCLVVDLRGMNRIEEIDTESRYARVQAGVVLEDLELRLNEFEFILGHDPWTVPVATVGGAISTNSVGYRAGIYGSMGEQVLGLEAVLPSGEILRTRAVSKHAAGIVISFATLWEWPIAGHAAAAAKPDVVIRATGAQFRWQLDRDTVQAGQLVEFELTSSDVNHGFAIYKDKHTLVAQTQAMPGYVNKLQVRFGADGPLGVSVEKVYTFHRNSYLVDVAFELAEDLLVRLAEGVREDVEASAMRHPDHGLARSPIQLRAGETVEARIALRLAAEGFTFDAAYTSVLTRAIQTLWIVLEEMDLMWLPVHRRWRLNERHYGALQGLNKKETAERFGRDQVDLWRRSYAVPPPPLDLDHATHPRHDPRYRNLAPAVLPASECLKDVVERMLPYWFDAIVPDLRAGKVVLVSAHGNSLRALVKHLQSISDDEIPGLNIPTGIPWVFELDDDLCPVSNRFLGDPEVVRAKAEAVAQQAR